MPRPDSRSHSGPSARGHGLVMLITCFVVITALMAALVLGTGVNRLVIVAVVLVCPLVLLVLAMLDRRSHAPHATPVERSPSFIDKERR